ncbi:tetratricopeptide repeat protein [Rubrobacter indicoceani]|uniref:tetratricopeptide repeat protein n=1 Tax=Rubrobacter indicoceani TaxID=2051957 RepID=UPI000E5C2311|nr:tetratricopeptide repeat protein [Rubrobacter indicoceani]
MEHEELLKQGETLAEEGLLEEALTRFEQALQNAPEDPEVLEAVGRALLNLGRLEEAEACYLDALELDPGWAAPRMGLALVSIRRDEPFKTVHHLERAVEADPEYPEAYVELGRYYGMMGEPALAKATFERWTKNHPDDADVLINAGLTSFDAADYAQALVFFEEALSVADDPEQVSGARTFRANSLDMLGRYKEAVAAYGEVIRESSDWWEAHANLGICQARNEHYEEAEATFRRGLAACPGSPEIRDELAAHLLAEKRNLPEALSLAEEAVALGRDEIRHLQTLAEVRLASSDDEGAEETFKEVLALDPENPDAHLELGIICDRRGESAEAEEHFMESLKSDPSNPRALYSYASIYYASGDLETAEEILVRAVSSDSSYSPALSALASIRARRGEYAASLNYLERAVEAGERDIQHFEAAIEFIPLRQDPRFRTLLLKMNGEGS